MAQQAGRMRRGRRALGTLLCAAAGAAAAGLPPIQHQWQLGYDLRQEDIENGPSVRDHLTTLFGRGGTYLYEPWIATVDAKLGLTFQHQTSGDDTSTGELVTGEGRLRLFPMSRFPFEGYFERSDSRVQSDLSGIDFELLRAGGIQRYVTRGGATLRLQIEHQELTQDLGRLTGAPAAAKDTENSARFTADKAVDEHMLSFTGDVRRLDRDDEVTIDTVFSSFRHGYRPGFNLSVDNLLSYNRSAFTQPAQPAQSFASDIIEYNGYAFWRPDTERPTVVNATVRALGLFTSTGEASADANAQTGTVGASYEWNPKILLTADAGLTRTGGEVGSEVTGFQRAGATYTGDEHQFLGFNYNWFGGAAVENSTDELGTLQSVSADVGHNVNRSLILGRSLLSYTGAQSTSAITDTDGRAALLMLHNMALTWSMQGQTRATIARLSLNDARNFGGGGRLGDERSQFQLVNFQVTADQRFGRSASLTGNLSLQLARQERDDPNFGGELTGEWRPIASVDIAYTDRQLLGVQRLRLRSALRFMSDAYLPIVFQPEDVFQRDDMDWDNRLEYSIGLLELRLVGRVSEFRENGRSLILFQARRYFNGF